MRDLMKYIASLFIFGFNGIFASLIDATSPQIVFMRIVIGGAVLLGIFLATGQRFTFWHHKRAFAFLILSGIAMGVEWMLLFEAFSYIGVGMATLLNYCGPILVIALAPLFLGEKLTWNKVVGIGVVIVGVIMLNGALSGALNIYGIACALLAAVCYAIMVIANKKAEPIVGFENATIQVLAGLVAVSMIVWVTGGFEGFVITTSSIPAILELGLLGTGAACLLYFSAMGGLKAQTVAVLGYLEPVAAVVLSAVILGETMTVLQIIGAAMVIGGACIAQLNFKANTITTPSAPAWRSIPRWRRRVRLARRQALAFMHQQA